MPEISDQNKCKIILQYHNQNFNVNHHDIIYNHSSLRVCTLFKLTKLNTHITRHTTLIGLVWFICSSIQSHM